MVAVDRSTDAVNGMLIALPFPRACAQTTNQRWDETALRKTVPVEPQSRQPINFGRLLCRNFTFIVRVVVDVLASGKEVEIRLDDVHGTNEGCHRWI